MKGEPVSLIASPNRCLLLLWLKPQSWTRCSRLKEMMFSLRPSVSKSNRKTTRSKKSLPPLRKLTKKLHNLICQTQLSPMYELKIRLLHLEALISSKLASSIIEDQMMNIDKLALPIRSRKWYIAATAKTGVGLLLTIGSIEFLPNLTASIIRPRQTGQAVPTINV